MTKKHGEWELKKEDVVVSANIPPVPKSILSAKAINKYAENDLLRHINEYIQDMLPRIGLTESKRIPDLRLAICAVASLIATAGQFAFKFPTQQYEIGICVVSFVILMLIMSVLDSFLIQSSCTFLKVDQCVFSLDSQIPHLSGTLKLRCRHMSGDSLAKGTLTCEESVSKIFDVDGYLSHATVYTICTKLIERFKGGERDSPKPSGGVKPSEKTE
uniref:Signal peptidase complex subunit 2 n=1 Tax=Chromera velia CCMP2878 TaxID=1169474 RepID=A0A0G4GLG3_9ALVE|eukprot:Cvel_22422.t1-p1 / transcript=Cvel_22422.t1 / gene=Cvel_22422 / organism=Chromera_velia_CCMP2878 / gene_product=hypothetical protein / transcript_product=hypothetical protein / location=Cvel_scaffold2201:400-3106(-) / protein_length=215 / sequence_SO=supercontig / SO=protein_coding / is_pseudo=false